MKRRAFLALLGSVTASWPADAQQRVRKVGVLLGVGNDAQGQAWMTAFQQNLLELGRPIGRDVQVELRWGGADIDYIRASATDLVNAKPDVILVYAVRVLNAMRQAT